MTQLTMSYLVIIKDPDVEGDGDVSPPDPRGEERGDKGGVAAVHQQVLVRVEDEGEARDSAHVLQLADLAQDPVLHGFESLVPFKGIGQELHLRYPLGTLCL